MNRVALKERPPIRRNLDTMIGGITGQGCALHVSPRQGVGIAGFRVKEHQRKALSPFDQFAELAMV
jgi:hypothetical protein